MSHELSTKEVERLEQFISEQKSNNTYLIDGKRDEDESTICRRTKDGSTACVKLKLPSTKLFAEMQRLNYFCILPQGSSCRGASL